ncbi:MAG TPA: hypothetical protein DCP06_04540 [Lachnospiraceae bacterium]|nr:hypothetical protein [Lachnospiraceae bacterium]
MAKIIYKAVGLLIVFAGALLFFGQRMTTSYEVEADPQSLSKETFPILMVETGGHTINPLYGYNAPLTVGVIRESMTPLDEKKTMTIHISEADTYLTELGYRIIDKETGEVYDTQTVKGFTSEQREVRLVLSYAMLTSTEYIMDLSGVLSDGREVHYYTRIKLYMDDSGLDDKLAFVKEFHDNTFKKSKVEEIAKYLEPDLNNRNSSLARVNIGSSSDLVTWAGMSPKIISDEYITIKEYNMETACVQYNYFVRANTASGTENYQIKEFYRVRHASGSNYLLAFERTMEAEYDVQMTNVAGSQLKLGITNKTSGKLLPTKDGKGLYYSRNGKLYFYDMSSNTVHVLYSIYSEDADYLRRSYNENDIRLVAVDESDALFFCVVGYQPRGAYEGDVGIALYRYTTEGELEELVNLPMDTSYRQLSVDFENYSYVSPRDVFYFTVANTVYAYNISGGRLEVLQQNVKDISFKTMENSNCYVWSSSLTRGYGESITIYNLENDEHQLIQSPDEDSYIRLLGTIESNVVYGYVHKNDIKKQADGTRIIPCYKLLISDTSGEVVKTYENEGYYVKNAVGSGNVVTIKLCKKSGDSYKNAGEDSILNRSSIQASKFSYTSRLTTKSLTEWYIKFPSTFTIPAKPKEVTAPEYIRTNNRMVRLEPPKVMNYYVSANGRITKSYEDVRKAIKEADAQMGVVISGDHKVVWERSGAFNQNNIGDITLIKTGNNVSNLAACASMILQVAADNNISPQVLTATKMTPYEMLEENIAHPLNLKGCTLDQVIYFVSNNKPVIAMTYDNKGVVIAGYTLKELVIYDPDVGKRTVSRTKFEEFFKNNGNRFMSYMG